MPPLPNRAELSRTGQEARTRVPPTVHAAWKPAADRPDPIALLEEQAKTRVPELVPVRYGRMAVSPFTFFRGAALPMAADLAATPTTRFHRPARRRRASLQLRVVRLARAEPPLRHERLR